MTYNVFIRRVQARMLGLRHKLSEAPFLEQYFEGRRLNRAISV